VFDLVEGLPVGAIAVEVEARSVNLGFRV